MYKFFIGLIFLTGSFASQPILEQQLYITRDPNTNREQFRKAMNKIGQLIAMEIAKDLKTKPTSITTVLDETAKHNLVDEDLVIVTILRPGLPMLNGMMKKIQAI